MGEKYSLSFMKKIVSVLTESEHLTRYLTQKVSLIPFLITEFLGNIRLRATTITLIEIILRQSVEDDSCCYNVNIFVLLEDLRK